MLVRSSGHLPDANRRGKRYDLRPDRHVSGDKQKTGSIGIYGNLYCYDSHFPVRQFF
jgi:hypothetical protein